MTGRWYIVGECIGTLLVWILQGFLVNGIELVHPEIPELGVVDVRPAFSRAPEQSLGCRYVQE